MNKFITMMVTLVVTLFAGNSLAFEPPASPAPQSWISDTSHVLTNAAHARLDTKLKLINQSTANEVAALVVPSLDGADIADVGDLTAKAWGVGKKDLDNGVLVVLAMKEHKSRISTGKGVEGDLPDLKCNDILQSARPYLRKGDVEGALGFIFDSASSAIANHKAEAAAQTVHSASSSATATSTTNNDPSNAACSIANGAVGADTGSNLSDFVLLFGCVAAVIILAITSTRRSKRQQIEEDEQRKDLRRKRLQRLTLARTAREQRERDEASSKTTPPSRYTRPVAPIMEFKPREQIHVDIQAAPIVATIAEAALEEAHRKNRAAEERKKQARDAAEEARRRREREEEDSRRRRREDESSSSSSSTSSSWDSSSSSSWSGDSDSGGSGDFGGGDSGGGGSSSDW
jgi:uncharacterized membrane protein YgcG